MLALLFLLGFDPATENLPTRLILDPLPVQEERPFRESDLDADPWASRWFPDTLIYRNYLADPVSPRSGSKLMIPVHADGRLKLENSIGSQRTIWRSADPTETCSIDIGGEGAVFSQFDLSTDWDLDAADYRFGFPVGFRAGRVSGKVHVWHLTSHMGDEYIERTGENRVEYHKNEVAVGVAYDVAPDARIYFDAGYGFLIMHDEAKPWRFQAGAEWAGDVFWQGPPKTYLATDVKWRHDTGWRIDIALQAGIWLVQEESSSTAGLRVLLEYFRGMSSQTQFLDERVEYWALGFAASF